MHCILRTYTCIKTYSLQEDLSNHMPDPVSIYVLTKKSPETVCLGWLNLNALYNEHHYLMDLKKTNVPISKTNDDYQ